MSGTPATRLQSNQIIFAGLPGSTLIPVIVRLLFQPRIHSPVPPWPWDTAPNYLLHDNDSIFSQHFSERVAGMNVKQTQTAYRSPWQNPYCERVIGSIRRDCLDHVIILNESHLRTILKSYLDYYHRCRTHLSLGLDCPQPRATDPPENGNVVAVPKVGGLHHLYTRKAA